MTRLVRSALATAVAFALSGGLASAGNVPAQPAPATDLSQGSGALSDKLGATNGVIHPQESVDPKMEKDAPATGKMPVIPPAGSPGGAPGAQPK